MALRCGIVFWAIIRDLAELAFPPLHFFGPTDQLAGPNRVLLITVRSRPEQPGTIRSRPDTVQSRPDGVYQCGPPLMSAAHTSPTLSLTSQIKLVKWDPGFTDFDKKSCICFEPGVKTRKLEKKVDRLSLSGVTR